MKQRESGVIRQCLQACAHERVQVLEPKHWNKINPPPYSPEDSAILGVAWRANNGTAKYSDKYFVRFGIRGQCDIEGMFRGGRRFGFECKQGNERLSLYQSWHMGFFSGLGMFIAVVRQYSDALEALRNWKEILNLK